MKIVKGIAIVFTFLILLGSCFEPPEFPDTPEIVFEDLLFKEIGDRSKADSLILTISFRDGDGDVGVDADQINQPFHELNFYAATSSQLLAIGTDTYGDLPFDVLNSTNINGKLLTYRDIRTNSNYDTLPRFEGFFRCMNYLVDTILVVQNAAQIIDDSYNILDTLVFPDGGPGVDDDILDLYIVADTFYIESNPFHYNLEIDFLTKDPSIPGPRDEEGFVEFNWRTYTPTGQGCGQTFDARVPVLGDTRALDGTIRYGMESIGFREIFKTNLMKFRITLRDRAMNTSNVIKTPAFTLDDIKN
ncbi:MAG TPA: hypothetical protein VD927_15960 [Chryseosolibacter sp.]|nr:hypothetical protein [Chryseosolibacter sp.]